MNQELFRNFSDLDQETPEVDLLFSYHTSLPETSVTFSDPHSVQLLIQGRNSSAGRDKSPPTWWLKHNFLLFLWDGLK